MEKVTFISKGVVLGNNWGGGQSGYAARVLEANSKEELLNKANEALKDGSLDSGMGYESLIGAALEITKITQIIVNNKLFTNKEYETEFIGDLDAESEDFLIMCLHAQ